jgi:Asp-tRNA(Asn)/Glu-tRNA(Gln) amidotransferase A subunit family amidase
MWRPAPTARRFTDVTADGAVPTVARALAKPAVRPCGRRDRRRPRARGEALGPLAGVPFAVKNLFDVAGACRPAPARRSIATFPPRRAMRR